MSNQSSSLPTLSVDLVRAAKLSEGILSNLDEESLQALETQYRKFFYLNGKYPNQTLAPTKILDEMWHLHILHPKAYFKDCMSILGYVLDHDPGFGKEPGTMTVLQDNFDNTGKLWEAEFGDKYYASSDPTQCRTVKEEPDQPGEQPGQDQPEISPDSPLIDPDNPDQTREPK